jgi:protein-S-isoprenylcysteine O-methyltransferase Ste14
VPIVNGFWKSYNCFASERRKMSPIFSRILQLLGLVVIQAVLLFFSAGSLMWSAGWWYIGLYVVMLALASFVMIPHHSEVIEERSKGTAGGKSWDLRITRLLSIPTLGLLILSGLDEHFRWTPPLAITLRIFGTVAFCAGYALVLWAMYTNQYFSQVVRIQTERGHVAVTEGPYRIVRHPGYLGMSTSMFGAVFILDSLWGFVCFALYMVLIITRTTLEDRTLQSELPGYAEYATRTKYRLIPGLW